MRKEEPKTETKKKLTDNKRKYDNKTELQQCVSRSTRRYNQRRGKEEKCIIQAKSVSKA